MKPSLKPPEKLPPHVVLAKRMLKISEKSTAETILQAALLVIKIGLVKLTEIAEMKE